MDDERIPVDYKALGDLAGEAWEAIARLTEAVWKMGLTPYPNELSPLPTEVAQADFTLAFEAQRMVFVLEEQLGDAHSVEPPSVN